MSSRYTEAVRGRIVTLETPAITIDLSALPPSLYIFSRLGARLVTRSNASRQNSILLCVHAQETFIINLDRDPFALDLLPPPSSFSSLVSLTPWLEIEFWKNSSSRSSRKRERERNSFILSRTMYDARATLLVYVPYNGRRKMIGIGRLGDKCPWWLGISSSR